MVERGMFSATISQMSAPDSSNTHEVIAALFTAMNTPHSERRAAGLPRWAMEFPYVNGGLFAGVIDVPRFSRTARAYLLQVGALDWKQINPDIFGSMIQAVADDDERGALGMHYTSVPNILKVLNPLFLDDLRAKLEEAGNNPRSLLNLRKRLARIRVFDPACGSGNFLVIAYKQMRKIEYKINCLRGEPERASDIRLTNFRGIELRSFAAEIARLALHIAEFQCDEVYRGQLQAIRDFIPLPAENWITCGNALRVDWLSVCPPTGTGVRLAGDDLFSTPLDQAEIDFENAGGETYICGNPPYLGARDQSEEQKSHLEDLFAKRVRNWKSLDYVAGWFIKAADYASTTPTTAAFVSTNSICQGAQVPILWPVIFATKNEIVFAHTSFKWSNLASHNAGVTVVIVGMSTRVSTQRRLYSSDRAGQLVERHCERINAYLAPSDNVIVEKTSRPLAGQSVMTFGNTPIDGGHLLFTRSEGADLRLTAAQTNRFVRTIIGSSEFIHGAVRYCLWIEDDHLDEALEIPSVAGRIRAVRNLRLNGGATARDIADRPHQFQRTLAAESHTIVVPSVSAESRPYLPVGLVDRWTEPPRVSWRLG
jgi:hypothetical protein